MIDNERATQRESSFFSQRGMPLVGTGRPHASARQPAPWLAGFLTIVRRDVREIRPTGFRRRAGMLASFGLLASERDMPPFASPEPAADPLVESAEGRAPGERPELDVAGAALAPAAGESDPVLSQWPVSLEPTSAGPARERPPAATAPPGEGGHGRRREVRVAVSGAADHEGPSEPGSSPLDFGTERSAEPTRSSGREGPPARQARSSSFEARSKPKEAADGALVGDAPRPTAPTDSRDRRRVGEVEGARARARSEEAGEDNLEDFALRRTDIVPAFRIGDSPAVTSRPRPAAVAVDRRGDADVRAIARADQPRAEGERTTMGRAGARQAPPRDALAGLSDLLTARRSDPSRRSSGGRRVQIGTLHVTVQSQPRHEPLLPPSAAPGAGPATRSSGADAALADPWSSSDTIFD